MLFGSPARIAIENVFASTVPGGYVSFVENRERPICLLSAASFTLPVPGRPMNRRDVA